MAAELKAKPRKELKRSYTKKLRKEGNIPGVIYGEDVSGVTVYVEEGAMIRFFHEEGRNGVINLDVEGGEKYAVMAYELQTDPLKNEITHIDFLKIDLKSEVDADVPIHLTGESKGEKEGGTPQHNLNEVSVKALPNDIPSYIEVDISELDIGDSLSVSDLKPDGKYEFTTDEEELVVSILAPSQEPVEEETEEEAEAAETESEENSEE